MRGTLAAAIPPRELREVSDQRCLVTRSGWCVDSGVSGGYGMATDKQDERVSTAQGPARSRIRLGSKYSGCALIELEQTTEALVTLDGTSMW